MQGRSASSRLRPLAALTLAVVLRLLREGLVVRALAWPGLLTALTLVSTAGVFATWGLGPTVAVNVPELVEPLQKQGLRVQLTDDPKALLLAGSVIHAIWKEGDRFVLGKTWGGRATERTEATLRDFAEDRWRMEVPPLQTKSGETRTEAALMAGVIGLLFTLYGVVMGAGTLFRDRSSGSLEADLALPVPAWMHAAARLLALLFVLGPGLVVSLALVNAILAIDAVGAWMLTATCAAVGGGTLGFALMASAKAERGFSGPLSRALTGTMAIMAFGWWQPNIGRFLPVGSVAAFMGGTPPSPLIGVVALALATLAVIDFGRRELL